MYPGGPNPTKLQSPAGISKLPLVLIHDGGGTSFSYFFLGDLGRDVWAIHNPNYCGGKKWPGGMDEMARHYITLMRNAGIRGKVLLGGWSLGGLLSLTMARMVANDRTALFTTAGIVIIDSPYHIPSTELDTPMVDPDLSHLPKLVQISFKHCDEYLSHWTLPTWTVPINHGELLGLNAGGRTFDVTPGQVLHLPLTGEWAVKDGGAYELRDVTEDAEDPVRPPPGIILRCLRRTEKPAGTDQDCTIDMFRDELLLGWGGRYPDFIKATLDIDSAHFDMFDRLDEKKLEQVTAQLRHGLEILDSLT